MLIYITLKVAKTITKPTRQALLTAFDNYLIRSSYRKRKEILNEMNTKGKQNKGLKVS